MLQKLTIRQKKLAEYLLIVAGTAVIAVSLQFFLDPDGMVPGGFTGIAIIVKELTKGIVPDGVPLWITNLVLHVVCRGFLLRGMFQNLRFGRRLAYPRLLYDRHGPIQSLPKRHGIEL